MPWGLIDDEAIEEAEALIGVPLRRYTWRWASTASIDNISHFAEAVGDDNPLWVDPKYGAKSWAGTNLAPPLFVYSVDATTVAPKFPGCQWIYCACEFLWTDVIRLDDKFEVSSRLTDVEKKSSEFSPLWVMQTGEVDYFANGAHVCRATNKIARMLRGEHLRQARGGKLKYEPRPTQRYTSEELDKIENDVFAEEVRGDESRFWEDVSIGDELQPVVKGPLTGTDIVGWYAGVHGARPYGGTSELVYKYRRQHADFHFNEVTGARDSAGRGHLEVQTGVDVGMGGAYDIGPQRISWAGHVVTNWMGDDGFLRHLNIEVRRPHLIGDTLWWKGSVRNKYVEGDYSAVDLDLVAINQMGDRSAWGAATVYLPSKKSGPVVLPVPTFFGS